MLALYNMLRCARPLNIRTQCCPSKKTCDTRFLVHEANAKQDIKDMNARITVIHITINQLLEDIEKIKALMPMAPPPNGMT